MIDSTFLKERPLLVSTYTSNASSTANLNGTTQGNIDFYFQNIPENSIDIGYFIVKADMWDNHRQTAITTRINKYWWTCKEVYNSDTAITKENDYHEIYTNMFYWVNPEGEYRPIELHIRRHNPNISGLQTKEGCISFQFKLLFDRNNSPITIYNTYWYEYRLEAFLYNGK